MSIRHFSFCISLLLFLGAIQGFAGNGGSRQHHTPESSDDWELQIGDKFLKIIRKSARYDPVTASFTIAGFYENGDIVTSLNDKISRSALSEEWAKVDSRNPLNGKKVYDEKDRIGTVSGFYSNGDTLLQAKKDKTSFAWRAESVTPFLTTMPVKNGKDRVGCDTQASETKVELSTMTKTECLDGKLCDQHRSPMTALPCGHFTCEECFPMENPMACISCIASKISGTDG